MKESFLVRILKYGIYGTAFVPLIIFKDFISPFHFGKIVVFRSIIEVLFVFYLILIWQDRSYLPRRNSIFWSLAIFTAAFGLTSVFSIQPYESLWGTLERMGGFVTFLHYFAFFVILISIFRTKSDWLRLLNITAFVGLLSAFYGFGQKTDIDFFVGSGNRARIFGTIGNAALFAGYELIIAFISLTLLLRDNVTRNFKLFYGFIFLIASVSVLMTATRGAILGLGLGLFVFAILFVWIYESRRAKNIILGFAALFIVFLIVSIFFKDSSVIKSSKYLSRITDLSLSSFTVKTRFWAWEAGLKSWNDSPKYMLLGWGPENFNIPFSLNFNPNFFQGPGSETLFDRAHNMFIEILVTMGIIGFLAYINIFTSMLKNLWIKIRKVPKTEAIYYIGMLALVVANIAHTTFFFDITANFILFFTIAAFVSFLSFNEESFQPHSNKKLTASQAAALIVLLGLSVWVINLINIKPAKANYATTRAIVHGWSGNPSEAVEKFKEAFSYDVMGVYEYRHRFAQFVFENNQNLDQSVLDFAIEEVSKNIESNPKDYLPLLYVSRLNILIGKDDPKSPYNDKALEYAQRALKLSPNFVRTYFEIGQAYINKREFDKAGEAFKKAAELNPDAGVSFWYWGVIEADKGNYELATQLIDKAFSAYYSFQAGDSDFQRLLNLYAKSKNTEGLIKVLNELVSRHPDKADYHAKLAAAYAQGRQIDNAIKHAKMAAELDSTYEQEAKAFVQAIGGKW